MAHSPIKQPNRALQVFLDEVGWRPETLARKINAELQRNGEKRRVHEKTPYRWLKGEVPHAPVPDIVVHLLTKARGQPVSFDAVWPNTTRRCLSWTEARDGMDVALNHTGLLQLLEEWSHRMLRRTFITLTGAALIGPAWRWLEVPPSVPKLTGKSTHVSPDMLSLIETIVTGAQKLDQQHGSAAADFVAAQFAAVSRLLRHSSYDAATGKRLCAALAQLAQTSGFMEHEALRDSHAQYWYLAGLHAAHCAGDRSLTASIYALMSNQASVLGQSSEALQLAAAAQEAAQDAPAAVQALVAARSTVAYAQAGDLAGVQRARDRTAALIEDADRHAEQRPTWTGYVTRTETDAIAGRALVILARHTPGRRRNALITEAETLLRARALDPTSDNQRSALRHGAWLSLAYLHAGDLDQALLAGRTAVHRLPTVTSARCAALLAELRSGLAPHAQRTRDVRDLIHDMDRQLSSTRGVVR
ncbi:hypothetical protein [Streptosporangium canum]|uniref:hypothetical protein n=1 Tax=Streptosporangium canum TaxID=324952 RepID=UPI0037BCF9EE